MLTLVLSHGASARSWHAVQKVAEITVQRSYEPYRHKSLKAVLRVRARSTGRCWTGSEAAYGRPDAWRCFRGANEIVDPCFASSRAAHSVACPDEVWNDRVIILTLSQPLPAKFANTPGQRRPFALVTATGLRCSRSTGQIPTVLGKPLLFDCGPAGALAGEPNTSHRLWTIWFSPSIHPTHLVRVDIATAWR